MKGILQDLGYAVRRLRAQPGFTIVTLLVFALGIGVNTAIFSIVNAALFRPLPVYAPGELVSIYGIREKGARPSAISYADYLDIRDQREAFSGILAFSALFVPVTAGSRTDVAAGEMVSGNYFDVLGIKPALGRTFLPGQEDKSGAAPVAVISNSFWKHRLNSDPAILGTTLKINGHSFTIVGVAPPQFKGLWFPDVASAQFWVPLSIAGPIQSAPLNLADRSQSQVLAIGRLASGVSLKHAQAIAETRARQLQQAYPETNRDRTLRLIPTNSVRVPPDPSSGAVPGLISVALMTVSGAVLLIAGTNIAGLLMARGITRRKEIAVRLAIGASRWQVVRQLLTESLLLSVSGGILGLLLAKLLVSLALANVPAQIEFIEIALDIPIDVRVLLFTALVCIVTGVLVGLLPALRASKTNLVSALHAEGAALGQKQRHSMRHWILIPQICFSLVLLLIAGLFVMTVLKAQWINPGFETGHAATASVDLRWNNYTEEKGRAFFRRLLADAQALPGVTAASLSNALPLSGANGPPTEVVQTERDLAAGNKSYRVAYCGCIAPGYFQSMSIPLKRGRDFGALDGSSAPPVVIVSEEAARRFWPGEEPLGQRLAFPDGKEAKLFEVVGVVREVRGSALRSVQLPYVYVPYEQRYSSRMVLVARCSGDPAPLVERLRRLVYQVDKNVAAVESKTLAANIGFFLYLLRMAAAILAVCGLVGLLLATVGLYGVVSYSVAQRTREIGIRAALGAQSLDIIKMVIGEGLRAILIGTILGLLLAVAARRYIWTFSLGSVALEPVMFIAVPVILGAIVLFACYLPARRAARVDPMSALREL